MVIVARHINGIMTNPLEYLKDDDDIDILQFANKKKAVEYLRGRGCSEKMISSPMFLDSESYKEAE